jgi:6-phosphogluconolactonase/glucosamine-6-phosphate isomerase/deaminase
VTVPDSTCVVGELTVEVHPTEEATGQAAAVFAAQAITAAVRERGEARVTIPALLAARTVQVVAPERRKAKAIARTLSGPIDTSCPATILRRQSHARLFLDRDSASLTDWSPAGVGADVS